MESEVRKLGGSEEELQSVKREQEQRFREYRKALNEKSILYDQMYVSARQLINRDQLIVNNEQEIMRIKYDIDISKLEMEQKKEMIDELSEQLEQLKTHYKELKTEIKRLEKRADLLTLTLKQKEDEMEQLEEILKDRDNIIEELQRQLETPEPVLPPKPKELKKQWYKPIKGDLVDELMAKYLNDMNCPLPVKRIGDGYYMFGTKKIFAKIMQGKLVIRVGGGYMSVEEFIRTYADFEVQKVQQLVERGLFNLDEYDNTELFQVEVSPGSKLI